MATIVNEVAVSVSEGRSRRTLYNLRASESDVDSWTQTEIRLNASDTRTITADRFIYLHIRDKLDLVIAPNTVTGHGGSISLSQVGGVFTIPFGCTVTLYNSSATTLEVVCTIVHA